LDRSEGSREALDVTASVEPSAPVAAGRIVLRFATRVLPPAMPGFGRHLVLQLRIGDLQAAADWQRGVVTRA
jgi:hypothetical protein